MIGTLRYMGANKNLRAAAQAKNDEFYTRLPDIENELNHYKGQFHNKTIFCNCDDPLESNFVRYFGLNFEHLGLKKLIATHYKESDLFSEEAPYMLEYDGFRKGENVPNPEDFLTDMLEDGDFRSEECVELLEESDVVVTNPPFSLFREYVSQLIEYKKKFLIVGNMNAISYKEIFSLIRGNKLWLGYSCPKEFIQPDGSTKKFGNICWFTNLEVKKRKETLTLYKKYSPEEYPKYDNYNAINVDKVVDIPADYEGAMGVPITFLDKYNPDQFEIIGLGISSSGLEVGVRPYKNEHRKYRKEIQGRAAVDGDLYLVSNGDIDVPYARILIKNLKPEK